MKFFRLAVSVGENFTRTLVRLMIGLPFSHSVQARILTSRLQAITLGFFFFLRFPQRCCEFVGERSVDEVDTDLLERRQDVVPRIDF